MNRSLSTKEFVEEVILKFLPYFYRWDRYTLGRELTPQELTFASDRHHNASSKLKARRALKAGRSPTGVCPPPPGWRAIKITDEMRADLDGPIPDLPPPPKHLLPILTLAEFLEQEERRPVQPKPQSPVQSPQQNTKENNVMSKKQLNPKSIRTSPPVPAAPATPKAEASEPKGKSRPDPRRGLPFVMLKLAEDPTLTNDQLRDLREVYNASVSVEKRISSTETETSRDARKALGLTLSGSGPGRTVQIDWATYLQGCKTVGWTPLRKHLEEIKGVTLRMSPHVLTAPNNPSVSPAPAAPAAPQASALEPKNKSRAKQQVSRIQKIQSMPRISLKKPVPSKTLTEYAKEREIEKAALKAARAGTVPEPEQVPEKIMAAPASFTPPAPAPAENFAEIAKRGAEVMLTQAVKELETSQRSKWPAPVLPPVTVHPLVPDLPKVRGTLSTSLSAKSNELLAAFKKSVQDDGCEVMLVRIKKAVTTFVEEDLA